MSVKVFLVESHNVVREGLKSFLEKNKKVRLVGAIEDRTETLKKIRSANVDVLLMNIHSPTKDGFEHVKKIKKEFPKLKILLLLSPEKEDHFIEILDCGSNGYVNPNCTENDLATAIQIAANDGIYTDGEFTLKMLERYKDGKDYSTRSKKPIPNLTERELEVLELMGKGYTNVEMANVLFTSVRTIETRRMKLLEKTKTQNTAMLIKYAVINGLIK
jgi:DNA-binding NarL/FixJ family response regulator